MKKITIIIPTYNRKINIKLLRIFSNFENKINVYIIDDGSKKNFKDYNRKQVKKYKHIKYFSYNNNKGQSYACNVGIKKTKSQYIWFFDDDDIVTIKTIHQILFNLNKNIDGFLLPMKQVYNNKTVNLVYPSIRTHSFDDLRNNGQLVSTSCAIFKTNLIKKIKGWDNKLYGGTDTDLFLRFSMHGSFDFLITDPVIINISQPNRLTNKVFRQQFAKLYFLKKHWKILTIKRRLYYIFTGILFYPLFYRIKNIVNYLKNN